MAQTYKIQLSDSDGNVYFIQTTDDLIVDSGGKSIKPRLDLIKAPLQIDNFDTFNPTILDLEVGNSMPVHTGENLIASDEEIASSDWVGHIQKYFDGSYSLVITVKGTSDNGPVLYARSYSDNKWSEWTRNISFSEFDAHSKDMNIHVSKEEKDEWNSFSVYGDDIENLKDLSTQFNQDLGKKLDDKSGVFYLQSNNQGKYYKLCEFIVVDGTNYSMQITLNRSFPAAAGGILSVHGRVLNGVLSQNHTTICWQAYQDAYAGADMEKEFILVCYKDENETSQKCELYWYPSIQYSGYQYRINTASTRGAEEYKINKLNDGMLRPEDGLETLPTENVDFVKVSTIPEIGAKNAEQRITNLSSNLAETVSTVTAHNEQIQELQSLKPTDIGNYAGIVVSPSTITEYPVWYKIMEGSFINNVNNNLSFNLLVQKTFATEGSGIISFFIRNQIDTGIVESRTQATWMSLTSNDLTSHYQAIKQDDIALVTYNSSSKFELYLKVNIASESFIYRLLNIYGRTEGDKKEHSYNLVVSSVNNWLNELPTTDVKFIKYPKLAGTLAYNAENRITALNNSITEATAAIETQNKKILDLQNGKLDNRQYIFGLSGNNGAGLWYKVADFTIVSGTDITVQFDIVRAYNAAATGVLNLRLRNSSGKLTELSKIYWSILEETGSGASFDLGNEFRMFSTSIEDTTDIFVELYWQAPFPYSTYMCNINLKGTRNSITSPVLKNNINYYFAVWDESFGVSDSDLPSGNNVIVYNPVMPKLDNKLAELNGQVEKFENIISDLNQNLLKKADKDTLEYSYPNPILSITDITPETDLTQLAYLSGTAWDIGPQEGYVHFEKNSDSTNGAIGFYLQRDVLAGTEITLLMRYRGKSSVEATTMGFFIYDPSGVSAVQTSIYKSDLKEHFTYYKYSAITSRDLPAGSRAVVNTTSFPATNDYLDIESMYLFEGNMIDKAEAPYTPSNFVNTRQFASAGNIKDIIYKQYETKIKITNIRFSQFGMQNIEGIYSNIRQWKECRAYSDGINILLGKVPTASHGVMEVNPLENATDGNLNTHTALTGVGAYNEAWIQFSFDNPTKIDRLEVNYNTSTSAPYYWMDAISVSCDFGETWLTLRHYETNGLWETGLLPLIVETPNDQEANLIQQVQPLKEMAGQIDNIYDNLVETGTAVATNKSQIQELQKTKQGDFSFRFGVSTEGVGKHYKIINFITTTNSPNNTLQLFLLRNDGAPAGGILNIKIFVRTSDINGENSGAIWESYTEQSNSDLLKDSFTVIIKNTEVETEKLVEVYWKAKFNYEGYFARINLGGKQKVLNLSLFTTHNRIFTPEEGLEEIPTEDVIGTIVSKNSKIYDRVSTIETRLDQINSNLLETAASVATHNGQINNLENVKLDNESHFFGMQGTVGLDSYYKIADFLVGGGSDAVIQMFISRANGFSGDGILTIKVQNSTSINNFAASSDIVWAVINDSRPGNLMYQEFSLLGRRVEGSTAFKCELYWKPTFNHETYYLRVNIRGNRTQINGININFYTALFTGTEGIPSLPDSEDVILKKTASLPKLEERIAALESAIINLQPISVISTGWTPEEDELVMAMPTSTNKTIAFNYSADFTSQFIGTQYSAQGTIFRASQSVFDLFLAVNYGRYHLGLRYTVGTGWSINGSVIATPLVELPVPGATYATAQLFTTVNDADWIPSRLKLPLLSWGFIRLNTGFLTPLIGISTSCGGTITRVGDDTWHIIANAGIGNALYTFRFSASEGGWTNVYRYVNTESLYPAADSITTAIENGDIEEIGFEKIDLLSTMQNISDSNTEENILE